MLKLVAIHGTRAWNLIGSLLDSRTGKQVSHIPFIFFATSLCTLGLIANASIFYFVIFSVVSAGTTSWTLISTKLAGRKRRRGLSSRPIKRWGIVRRRLLLGFRAALIML